MHTEVVEMNRFLSAGLPAAFLSRLIGKILITILLLFHCIHGVNASERSYLSEDEACLQVFPEADSFPEEALELNEVQKTELGRILGKVVSRETFSYRSAVKDNDLLGYAVTDRIKSRSEEISYLVGVSPALEILSVEILTYDSARGAKVREPRFLDQFTGRSASTFNRDRIRYVSGATLSSVALAQGIRTVLACLEVTLPGKENAVDIGAGPVKMAGGAAPYGSGGDGGRPVLFRRSRFIMGTLLEIALFTSDEEAAAGAFSEAFSEAGRLDRLLSVYHENSEISRLNRHAGEWFEVSPEVLSLLRTALDLGRKSGGGFDISVGPLIELWKGAEEANRLPSSQEVRRARELTGPGIVQIDPEGSRIRLAAEGASINLGGIGKGYAIDRISEILLRKGIDAALLNFGGNIRALGPPPGENGWVVAIADPSDPEYCLDEIILDRGSISTSADYERGLRIGGEAFSHIIDPLTGYPAGKNANVTVIAETACEADSLSTGLFILGLDRLRGLAEPAGLPVMAVSRSGESFRSQTYPGRGDR